MGQTHQVQLMADRSSSARNESPARILIAEDQDDIVEAIRMSLRGEGIEADSVSSPEAVITRLAATPFDLLLMDMNFHRDTTSGTEGLELLERVREINHDLPVIAMTAWGNVEIAVEAMRHGAVNFIQKPWDNWHLVNMIRTVLQSAQDRSRARSEHEREMQDAVEMQRRLLCRDIPTIKGMDVAVHWRPARELGGDYFEITPLDANTVAICIADVEGKGVAAALLTSNLQSAVKAFASSSEQTSVLCCRLNAIFCEQVNAERSISFFYGLLNTQTRRLRYTNAGHMPQVLVRKSGDVEKLDTGGAVLGRLPHWTYSEAETTIASGDSLILFTDGITEAENQQGEEFGEERLTTAGANANRGDASSLQQKLLAEVVAHCDNHFRDDATLLILHAL